MHERIAHAKRIAYAKGLLAVDEIPPHKDPEVQASYEKGKEARANRKLRPSLRF
jgi:hypothetical protein